MDVLDAIAGGVGRDSYAFCIAPWPRRRGPMIDGYGDQ